MLPTTQRRLLVGLTILVGLWAVGVALASQVGSWLADQLFLASGLDVPTATWPGITLVAAVLIAAPTVPMAIAIRRYPRLRAVSASWAVASGCLAVLGMVRLIPIARNMWALVAFTLVAGGLALILWLRRTEHEHANWASVLTGAAVGLAILLPWLWLGSLGSWWDTTAAVLAAAAGGTLAGVLLSTTLWPAFAETSPRWKRTLLGGLPATVALTVLAAGFGLVGTQLAVMFCLPLAGFAIAALDGQRQAGAVLCGIAILGPLAFVDPEEMTFLLGLRDIGTYALFAALGSLAVAGLASIVLGALPVRRIVAAVAAGVLLVSGIAVFTEAGQPGFHGEKIFVVLRDQAEIPTDVSTVDERRTKVYETLVSHAERTQKDIRQWLDDRGLDYTPYYLVNAIETVDDPIVRAELAARSDVDRVLDSPQLRPLPVDPVVETGDITSPPDRPEWNIADIGAPQAWASGVTGQGIVVGESDSGVDGDHPALRSNYRGRESGGDYNWYDPWNSTDSPTDLNGHGTHTTASAVGSQNLGVAPGAEWIGCVNLARNFANPGYYLDCLQFMLAPFPQGGNAFTDGDPARSADVLNNSWGCPEAEGCDATVFLPAVRALRAAGIFVVVSAGNTGPFCGSVEDPLALYDEVLSVGASDSDAKVTLFSSRGPIDGSDRKKPDLVAPGAEILSALPDGTYGRLDGTSMSGPHVAGVVALMWQANPALVGDIEATTQILLDTATPAEPTQLTPEDDCGGEANITGAGIVNAAAAVKLSQSGR